MGCVGTVGQGGQDRMALIACPLAQSVLNQPIYPPLQALSSLNFSEVLKHI